MLGVASAKEGQFGTLELSGKYTGGDAPKFDGRAIATITKEYDLNTKAFGYSFYLCQKSGFGITLENSEFTKFDGQIGILARQKAKKKGGMQGDVRMDLSGDGDKSSGEWIFNGTASATLQGDINVGTAGVYDFSIQSGTGVLITVENSKFTSIEGTLKGKVTEKKKDFLGFECWVRYAAGAEGEDGTIDALGSCKLLGEKELLNNNGYVFALLPTPGPTAFIDVQQNEVKKVGGELSFRLKNTNVEGDPLSIKGFAKGEYDNETKMFSGSGAIFLESDLKFNLSSDGKARIVLKKGSGGQTDIVNNELTHLGGKIIGELITEDKPLVRLEAEGDYNAVTNVLERFMGKATLLRTMELGPEGNPWIIVHKDLSAQIEVRDNQLISAEAQNGKFDVPALNMQGGFDSISWSCATGKNVYKGKGFLKFEMLKEDKELGRKLGGRVDLEYREDDTWNVHGKVDYRLNHYIGGSLDVEMDQAMDPTLGGTLTAGPMNVMEGRELFQKKLTLFKMKIPFVIGIVPASFNFGAEGYIGLDMLPMRLSGTFGVSNFKPKAMNVPDFAAEAELDWGFKMKAGLMAYADLRIDVGIASAGGGLKGIAEMGGEAKIKANAKLNAKAGKYWGELGVGLSFAPTAVLKAQPYLTAELGEKFDYDFDAYEYQLGEIFKYDWGTTYKFGDAPPTNEENGQRQAAPGGQTKSDVSKETSSVAAESYGKDKTPQAPTAKAGTPAMESGAELADKKEKPKDTSKPPSEMSELEKTMKFAGDLGEVAGAAAFIIGELIVLIGSMLLGPIVFVLVLCWKWISGALKKVFDAIEKVGKFIEENWDLIADYMPGWWKAMMDFFDNPSSAIDKWWNGDVYTRDAVAAGEHVKAPAEVRGKMVETLFSGIAQEGDRRAMETIFAFSAKKGDLHTVISESGSSGDDFADSWWYHGDWGGSRLERIWDENGVEYS